MFTHHLYWSHLLLLKPGKEVIKANCQRTFQACWMCILYLLTVNERLRLAGCTYYMYNTKIKEPPTLLGVHDIPTN